MIYYLLSIWILADIKQILIRITSQDKDQYKRLLLNENSFVCHIQIDSIEEDEIISTQKIFFYNEVLSK